MEHEEKEGTQIESAEDLAAETQQLGEVKEDAIREEVIKEYGFDPDADKERIDKAVKREMGHRKSLSKAVGQKVKYRTEFTKLKGNPSGDNKGKNLSDEDLDAKLDARLDQRELNEMEYPDEIKEVIKQVAAINKFGIRKALKDPYVVSKIDAWKKAQGIDDAALSNKDNKHGSGGSGDVDLTPPDVDLSTEEGRKAYDKWKEDMKKAGH